MYAPSQCSFSSADCVVTEHACEKNNMGKIRRSRQKLHLQAAKPNNEKDKEDFLKPNEVGKHLYIKWCSILWVIRRKSASLPRSCEHVKLFCDRLCDQAPVVQRVDNFIQWIGRYAADKIYTRISL